MSDAEALPPEFKRDVVAVARTSGLTHAQVADDFGISEHSVQRWLRQADIDDGVVEGTTSTEQDELVALKRRNRVLEQEVEILRRATAYFAKDAAPKWRFGNERGGGVVGAAQGPCEAVGV